MLLEHDSQHALVLIRFARSSLFSFHDFFSPSASAACFVDGFSVRMAICFSFEGSGTSISPNRSSSRVPASF